MEKLSEFIFPPLFRFDIKSCINHVGRIRSFGLAGNKKKRNQSGPHAESFVCRSRRNGCASLIIRGKTYSRGSREVGTVIDNLFHFILDYSLLSRTIENNLYRFFKNILYIMNIIAIILFHVFPSNIQNTILMLLTILLFMSDSRKK